MKEKEFIKVTKEHIENVGKYLDAFMSSLLGRRLNHDDTKLQSPEKEIFIEYTPKLKSSTFGSDEYKGFLKGMGEALKHHYRFNRHHPEHWEKGIKAMDLADLIEMLCDWKAATLRHENGDIKRSIEINQKRFGYGEEIKQLLLNSLKYIP